MSKTEKIYSCVREIYAEAGVDTEAALRQLDQIALSIHAWQGDDVHGFENTIHALTGGCQVTGNYPGCARNSEELRADLDEALKAIPGKHRVCLQAHEVDHLDKGVDRDGFTAANFDGWIAWAKERKLGLDIAPVYYSHPKLDHGLSLSHPDGEIRAFWVRHGQAVRRIGEAFGRELGTPCVCNQWAPDGFKDILADRLTPRIHLAESLDAIFADRIDEQYLLDAVESKLFGIGTESCTVGSHDFYLTYAAKRGKLICLDSGHFHPTESIGDKISSIAALQGRILLHVSRGVHWDSDHVIVLNDELSSIARETVRCCHRSNIHIGLDYFDASINRIVAWAVGARNMQKALLIALLEPFDRIAGAEKRWDFSSRLALMEEAKSMPWGAVYDYYCESRGVPVGDAFLAPIFSYEKNVLSRR
ncbi:MAG: L-rhamnose isomerase [Victivallaceae bacterium]|nr:L-rhamnose isomerase [Victivallaceae bacterium]